MPVFRLSDQTITFPNPNLANADGVLAVGGDLSPERLLLAYQMGIFPWYNQEDPIIWWSPNPRFVLIPKELKVTKSMRPYFNQKKFDVTADERFEEVMRSCQAIKRKGQQGSSWITEKMLEAYCRLHRLGYAHSVEVWDKGELVGGLYGLSLGKIFFGESMFANVSNASKYGFIRLVEKLRVLDFQLVDCQQPTKHLASMGAKSISRQHFLTYLKKNEPEKTLRWNWSQLFQ